MNTPTTRRQAIITGGLGAAAAAFLAACGTKDKSKAGQSGLDPTTTLVTPTVPVKEPSEADKDTELTNLRTATSLELVVAAAYGVYGPKLTDQVWRDAAVRFGTDHEALAEVFSAGIEDAANRIDEPNVWVQESMIDPVKELLASDTAIANFFSDLESMLAATYVAAVPEATTTEWRGQFATIAAGAARRAALLGNGGAGAAPTTALYPGTDLVSNQAKLPLTVAAEGEAEEETAEGE